jgi:hypothetical protein
MPKTLLHPRDNKWRFLVGKKGRTFLFEPAAWECHLIIIQLGCNYGFLVNKIRLNFVIVLA